MARQQAAQRPLKSQRTGLGASPLIHFGPELAVRAITFHLADEGISARVTDESAESMVSRLKQSSLRLSVEQCIWSDMTNPQRLEWLLEKTQTIARLVGDELSVLEPDGK